MIRLPQKNKKCRMCGNTEERVNHVLSECSKLLQKEYKRQNDWFGTENNCKIYRKYEIKWHEHKLEVVKNIRHYGTSQYTQIMKYMGEDQMSLWYRKIKIFAR